MASFPLVDEEVGTLLLEFGPSRDRIHAEYPFWRLRRDGVWEVTGATGVRVTQSGDPYRRDLSRSSVLGGFPEAIYNALRDDPSLAVEIACSLVRAHFPLTLQEDVLEATGIETKLVLEPRSYRYPRDSAFRRIVLKAYNFGCALCGFSVRLGIEASRSQGLIALDAAHIKWHEAHGPAMVQNGIALCALHHRLFDCGAFTLSRNLVVVVAESVQGTGSEEWLWRFSGQPLPAVLCPDSKPDPVFLDWHLRNVFRHSVGRQPPHLPGKRPLETL